MIVTKEIEIKISSSNFKWYVDKGYSGFRNGDIITVSVEDLTRGSGVRVDVECQSCLSIINVQINNYNNQLKRYDFYVCKNCCFDKIKKTNIDRYGTECALRNADNIEKTKNTLLKKYGVDNISKAEHIREDRVLFMKENTKKYNMIIKDKYGDNVSKLDWVKIKKKETYLKNWGVENPSQNLEIFEKSQLSGKKIKIHENGLFYRGSYEKDFLDHCLKRNITVDRGLTIRYNFNGKEKYYHSDFYIKEKNLIIEIKSSYYYLKYKDKNESKKNATNEKGYTHLLIIDKDYTQFNSLFE